MTDNDITSGDQLAAGVFSSWLREVQGAIRGDNASNVPCGTCTACCTASQFIHIAPDETDTLSHIPADLLFPAPLLPRGHLLMGFDQRGHCPMLIDNQCSIYEHRPRTCRTYDCRVFPAADIYLDDDDNDNDNSQDYTNDDNDNDNNVANVANPKFFIAEQSRRWRFSFPTDNDRLEHAAVIAAASYLSARRNLLNDGRVALDTTHRAVQAIEIHDVFLSRDPTMSAMTIIEPDVEAVRVALSPTPRRQG